MPCIRPFKALRYDTDIAGPIDKLVAPPYDIIYDGWRDRLYERSDYNIIRLIKTREESSDNDPMAKYERAGSDIREWIGKGVLRYEDKPSIYVRAETYTVDGESRTRFGFIALLRLEDFGKNIHPHERTLSGPREDRLKLVKATKANLSQIFSIYQDPDGIIEAQIQTVAAKTPDIHFTDEQGIVRRMWVVSDSNVVNAIVSAMKDREVIIADGHHRYETALEYKKFMELQRKNEDEPFDYVSMYFSNADSEGMTILPTHRKVFDLDHIDKDEFFRRLAVDFDIEYIGKKPLNEVQNIIADLSAETSVFAMYTRDGYRIARLKNPVSPKRLDVEVLHEDIVEGLLDITKEDIAAGRFLHFSKSAEHALEDVDAERDQMAIIMNSITSDELFRTVLQGKRMPQKSTYFFPKTMSGLVMYSIDDKSIS